MTVAGTAEEMERHLAAWQRLTETASEPNVFYEPWMLLPALRHYHEENIRAVFVYEQPAAEAQRLIGLFPLQALPSYRGLRLRCLRTWEYPYCYLGTPLLARGAEEACWSALFAWLSEGVAGAALSLRTIAADGPVYGALRRVAQRERHSGTVSELDARPLALADLSGEEYLGERVGKSHRQAFRRKRRRLAEVGRLEAVTLKTGDDLEAWLEEFFAVEASGWKGAEGTALACAPRDLAFFREISRAAFERGRLLLQLLRLDGRAIAGLYTLVAAPGAFAIKTGYDEQWGQYSPGRLLAIELVNAVHERPGCQWLDSCAAPRTSAADVWKEQRMVADALYGVGLVGGRVPALLSAARAIKRRLPGWRGAVAAKKADPDATGGHLVGKGSESARCAAQEE